MTTEDKTVDPATALLNAQRLFETFDAHFRFKPGDVVALREIVEGLKAELEAFGPRDRYGGNRSVHRALVVSERVLRQCHGGVQGSYHVLERDADHKGIISVVPTHAVLPYAELTAALKALAPPPKKDAVDGVAAVAEAAGIVAEIAGTEASEK